MLAKIIVCLSYFALAVFACENDCNGRGICDTVQQVCKCQNGYYGNDCADTIQQALPAAWISSRVIICVFFGVLLAVFSYILWHSVRAQKEGSGEEV
jgi:hypothetical protein